MTQVYVPKSIAHPRGCSCEEQSPCVEVTEEKEYLVNWIAHSDSYTLIRLSVVQPHGPRQLSIKASLIQAVE